ncbi:MAG: SufS family cysteine desulfurase [Acidimicrobiia bacterium]|nr:SufS family cysteine desulfurase [Acidimicrobiia bacterium]
MGSIRDDFPLLAARPDLAFLDSAASAQKPRAVLEAMETFQETRYANVHRGAYRLSQEATVAYEGARATVARFIGAPDTNEVCFTRGTTTALNTLAFGLAPRYAGKTVLLTEVEHHANFIPWQQWAQRVGATVRYVPFTEDHRMDMAAFDDMLDDDVAVVSLTGMSNVLGTVPPVAEVAAKAKAVGALTVVDGAQMVPHMPVDVAALGIDAIAFGAHKMLGPTGIGAMWARAEILDEMEPFETGGEMILDVTFEGATWAKAPAKFEAGTPPIVEAVGFAAAVEYLEGLGMDWVEAHDKELTAKALERLQDEVPGISIQGPLDTVDRGGAISFTLDGIHAHDLATILDEHGVAVRAGHHCAKPLMSCLGVAATARASFYVYNTEADIDPLVKGLRSAIDIFG